MKIVDCLRHVKVDLCFRFRQWFLRPLKREDELNDRLDVVTFFTNHRNVEAVTSIQTCLKDIRNLEVKVIFRSDLYEVQNLIFFQVGRSWCQPVVMRVYTSTAVISQQISQEMFCISMH